ncbi:hypothetical protein C1H46_012986 [Malus baccata]|uniref:Uncharacterized protein n=1 Tax=Malus baccata TaxID=106549 RepID=A0A540MRI9_MALBA|nr:hypothetical protein C1H46_012986 [Malus baccata]
MMALRLYCCIRQLEHLPSKEDSNSYISDVPLGPNFLRLAAGAAAHIVVFGQD